MLRPSLRHSRSDFVCPASITRPPGPGHADRSAAERRHLPPEHAVTFAPRPSTLFLYFVLRTYSFSNVSYPGIPYSFINRTNSAIGIRLSRLPGIRYPFNSPPSNHFPTVRLATLQTSATSPVVNTFLPFAIKCSFHHSLRHSHLSFPHFVIPAKAGIQRRIANAIPSSTQYPSRNPIRRVGSSHHSFCTQYPPRHAFMITTTPGA